MRLMDRHTRRVLGAATCAAILVGGCVSDNAQQNDGEPSVEPTPAVEESALTIRDVAVWDVTDATYGFTFVVDTEIESPPAPVACWVSYGGSPVFTAAGTMVDEARGEVEFDLTSAKAGIGLTLSLFSTQGVDIDCETPGAEAHSFVDLSGGDEEATTTTTTTTTTTGPDRAPAGGPAMQLVDIVLTRTAAGGGAAWDLAFTAEVESAEPGDTMSCRAHDASGNVTLAEEGITLDDSDTNQEIAWRLEPASAVDEGAWIVALCEIGDVGAVETLATADAEQEKKAG